MTIPVILDTNVCLDLFVFHDARCHELKKMLETGIACAVTREDCRNEWIRVLEYATFSLSETARRKCISEYDALISCRDFHKKDYTVLPVCQDKDDQKFLELAYDANAGFLLTKDKALLKLSAKTGKQHLFHIIRPEFSARIGKICESAT